MEFYLKSFLPDRELFLVVIINNGVVAKII